VADAEPGVTTTTVAELALRGSGIVHHEYSDDGDELHQHECTRCGWHNRPLPSRPRSETLALFHAEDCPRKPLGTAQETVELCGLGSGCPRVVACIAHGHCTVGR
jgi:hypothetical protein